MFNCIHIQTYPPHFHYTYNLVNNFKTLTNCKELNIPIFIIFDTPEIQEQYKKKYPESDCNYINLKTIVNLNNFDYLIFEKYKDLCNQNIHIKEWGSGDGFLSTKEAFHRTYVCVKRLYSILELERLGYKNVWCIDGESHIFNKVNLNTIFEKNNILTVGGKNHQGFRPHQIIKDVFKLDYNSTDKIFDISIRVNDFWIVNTNHFKNMVQLINKLHNIPISHIINGSEQSLYEYYMYDLYLKGENNTKIIELANKFNLEKLNRNMYQYKTQIEIDNFAEEFNKVYFDKIPVYRGDWWKFVNRSYNGLYLLNKLNIDIAVSNFQEENRGATLLFTDIEGTLSR